MFWFQCFTVCSQLKVHTKLADGQDFDLDIHLSHPIMPDQTVSKVMTSKVSTKRLLFTVSVLLLKWCFILNNLWCLNLKQHCLVCDDIWIGLWLYVKVDCVRLRVNQHTKKLILMLFKSNQTKQNAYLGWLTFLKQIEDKHGLLFLQENAEIKCCMLIVTEVEHEHQPKNRIQNQNYRQLFVWFNKHVKILTKKVKPVTDILRIWWSSEWTE